MSHNGLGNIAKRKGDTAEAIADFERALQSDPGFAPAHMNLGVVLADNGEFDKLMAHFQRCIELMPNDMTPIRYMAVALVQQGKTDEAIANFRKALAADSGPQAGPDLALMHTRFAVLLAERDEVDEAMAHFRRAIEIEPDAALCYQKIAELLRKQGKTTEATRFDVQAEKARRRYAEKKRLKSPVTLPSPAGPVGDK